jgi:hypothetical protein
MRVAAYALRSIREPYTSVQYDQIICMVLRSGSFESGVRRSEMKKYAYDAAEMILAPRHVDQWFRTDDLYLLVVGISDAALTAACDGCPADLRYGGRLHIRAVT